MLPKEMQWGVLFSWADVLQGGCYTEGKLGIRKVGLRWRPEYPAIFEITPKNRLKLSKFTENCKLLVKPTCARIQICQEKALDPVILKDHLLFRRWYSLFTRW